MKKTITEPKRSAPVSPKNTFLEGLKLKNKKPEIAPTIDGTTKYISEDVIVIIPPIKTKNFIESSAAKPSIPSIKLKAFKTTINTKIETIYDAQTGIS